MSKKMKAVDSAAGELQRRAEDASAELQSSRTEIQRLITELQRARASCDEMQARQDAAGRDNKQLTGYIHTYIHTGFIGMAARGWIRQTFTH